VIKDKCLLHCAAARFRQSNTLKQSWHLGLKPRQSRRYWFDAEYETRLKNGHSNACICCLGEVAAVLHVFAKQVTVYPNPA
jgi:hypothetical protein